MQKNYFEVERPRKKEKKCSPLFCKWGCISIPQRVVLAVLLHLAFQNAFNLRVVLNVAITVMVEPAQPKNITDHACPELLEVQKVENYGQTFDWPRSVEAMVLYAFYLGYVISQIPGGILADRFGARWVLFFSLSCSSVLTAIFPALTSISGYWVAVVVRFFLGLVQGPIMASISTLISHWLPNREQALLGGIAYCGGNLGTVTGAVLTGVIIQWFNSWHGPIMGAISTLVSHWIPQREQTLLGGIAYSGSNLGTVVGGVLTGVVIQYFNSWHAAFYFWSCISCIYLTLHLAYLYSYPSTHKHICPEELEFIEKEVVKQTELVVPWKKILTNVPYLANISGQFGHNFIQFILGTCLPLYMKEILAFNIKGNAFFSALPFFFLWVFSIIYSVGAGLIRRKQLISSRVFTGIFGPFLRTENLVVPWKKILTNVPYLANISGQFGHNFIHFILSTCLPLFMKEILAFHIQSNALFSALPFFFMWIFSLLYSMTAGWLRRKQLVSSRLFTGVFGPFSNIGASVCVLAAVYAGCSRQASVILYTLGMIIKPFFYCTISVNVNELSKNYGGTMFAIANTVATVGGIFGNWLVGYLTADGKLSQWRMVFWINLVIAVVTSLIFAVFASSKRQDFDYQPHEYHRAPDNEKSQNSS